MRMSISMKCPNYDAMYSVSEEATFEIACKSPVKSSERVVFMERRIIVSAILQFVGILWYPVGIQNWNALSISSLNLRAIYLIHSSPKIVLYA